MNLIDEIEKEQIAAFEAEKSIPDFQPGDTVKVNVKVIEGSRERVQAFEGVCIARSGGGLNENFTVRKISYGEGVERVFPIYSPLVANIEVVRRGRVAKLYYLRGLTGKAARIAERRLKTGKEIPTAAADTIPPAAQEDPALAPTPNLSSGGPPQTNWGDPREDREALMSGTTLYDKIWQAHLVSSKMMETAVIMTVIWCMKSPARKLSKLAWRARTRAA